MKNIWEGKEEMALRVLTALVKGTMKDARLQELNPERFKRAVGQRSKDLQIPKEELLVVTKILINDFLTESMREIEEISFQK